MPPPFAPADPLHGWVGVPTSIPNLLLGPLESPDRSSTQSQPATPTATTVGGSAPITPPYLEGMCPHGGSDP